MTKEEIKHNEIIATRIQELSDQKNLSANRISILADMTPSTVDSIYKGRSKNPTIKTIFNICKALDMSVEDFFDFYPYNENPNNKKDSPEQLIEQVRKLSSELYELEKKLEDKVDE